jgi:hypothetical protein
LNNYLNFTSGCEGCQGEAEGFYENLFWWPEWTYSHYSFRCSTWFQWWTNSGNHNLPQMIDIHLFDCATPPVIGHCGVYRPRRKKKKMVSNFFSYLPLYPPIVSFFFFPSVYLFFCVPTYILQQKIIE